MSPVKRSTLTKMERIPMTDWYGTHGNPAGGGWGDSGTGLYWAIDADELNGPNLKVFATGPPLLAQLPRISEGETPGTIYGGSSRTSGTRAQQAAPYGPNPGYHWRVEYTDISVRSEFPTNEGNLWGTILDPVTGLDHDGTTWGMRCYGISEGFFLRLDTQDIFGKSQGSGAVWDTTEGHAMYCTLSAEAGKTLALTDCNSINCGGHAFYFTSAYSGDQKYRAFNALRVGRAVQPELGGQLIFTNCHALNTDQSQTRGAYAFNLVDVFSFITLDGCSVTYNIPDGFFKNGGPPSGSAHNSRAALSVIGTCEGLLVTNGCTFTCPDPSDRTNQVSIYGPRTVTFEDSHFDCASISVNHTNSGWFPGLPLAESLTISNCTGRAAVFWDGEYIGQIDALNDTWFHTFRSNLALF